MEIIIMALCLLIWMEVMLLCWIVLFEVGFRFWNILDESKWEEPTDVILTRANRNIGRMEQLTMELRQHKLF